MDIKRTLVSVGNLGSEAPRSLVALLVALLLLATVEVSANETSKISAGIHEDNQNQLESTDAGLATTPLRQLAAIEVPTTTDLADQSLAERNVVVDLSEAEAQWIQAHPIISIAATPDWPPFEWKDEATAEYKGITADFIRLAAEKVGLRLAPEFGRWGPLIEKLKAKQIDVAPGLNQTPERDKFLLFSEIFVEHYSVIFTTKDRNDINSIGDLGGKTVVVEKGYALSEILPRDHPEINIKLVDSTVQALQAVSAGEADAFIGNRLVGNYLIKKFLIADLTSTANFGKTPSRYRFGIRNDWPILRTILDKGLAAITEDERGRIIKRHTGLQLETDKRVRLTDKERDWLAQHDTIRLGIDPAWPPFEFIDQNGVYSGLAAGYVEVLSKRLQLTMTPQTNLSWSEAIRALQRGQGVDVLPAVAITPDRRKFLNFTAPYMSFPTVIATRRDAPYIGGLSDLGGKRVGVVRDYFSHEIVTTNHPEIIAVTTESVADGLRLLENGELDAFVDSLGVITYEQDRLGFINIKIAAPTKYRSELSFGVRKDWPELVSILNKALATIDDKERTSIKNTWTAINVSFGFDIQTILKWVLPIGGVAFGIVIFVVVWNQRLAKEVTERKRAEQALAEKEAQLRLAMDNMPGAMFMADENLMLVIHNQQYQDMYDLADESVREGASLAEAIRVRAERGDYGPGDPEELVELRMRGYIERMTLRREEQLPNGRIIELSSRPVDGGGVVGIATDITERKQAEEARRESESRFRQLFEQTPIAITREDWSGVKAAIDNLRDRGVSDLKAYLEAHPDELKTIIDKVVVLSANDMAVSQYKAPDVDAFIAFNNTDAYSEEEIRKSLEIICTFADGGTRFECEAGQSAFDGSLVDALVVVLLAPGSEDDWKSVIFTNVDITERKQAEEELRESQALFEQAAHMALLGHYAFDEVADRVVDCSEEVARIHGITVEQYLAGFSHGGDELKLVHPDDRAGLDEVLTAAKEQAVAFDVEYRIVRPDGEERQVRELGEPVLDAAGALVRTIGMVQDITERKRAEERLSDSEKNIRQLVEDAALGAVVTADSDVLFVNKAAMEIIGIASLDELKGSARLSDRVYEEDRAMVKDIGRRRAAGEEAPSNYEVRIVRTAGELVWLDVHVREIEWNGIPAQLVWLIDITERKRAEGELAKSRELLQALADNHPDFISMSDPEGRYLFVNKCWEEWSCMNRNDVVGKTVFEVYPEAKAIEVNAVDERALAGPEVVSDEFTVTSNDGKTRTVIRTRFPVISSQGELLGLGNINTDITERKRAEEALREKSNTVELLHKTASDANRAEDIEQALQGCVDAICTHTGWPVGHVYVRAPDEPGKLMPTKIWYLDKPRRFAKFRKVTEKAIFESGVDLPGRVLESGKPAWIADVTKDSNFPRAKQASDIGIKAGFAVPVLVDGDVAAVFEFFSPEAAEPDEALLDILNNVSGQVGRVIERKRAEEALLEARDLAEAATKAKAEFLATMSHEIRTPMNGVIGMVDVLRQTRLESDQRQMLGTVRESAYSLLTIINDILDFSKIEAGKLDLEEIPTSICDVVEGVAETLAPIARNKGIGLSTYVDPEIPDAVLGDQTRLRQILFNLGGNAVKFTEHGRVMIRADRLPLRSKNKIKLRFEIIDSGIGISEEGQKALFQEFVQAETSTARRFGGTGLGLTICQRLTEMMGGAIEVESKVGTGSTFSVTVTLPLADDHTIKPDGVDLGGLNVLMVMKDQDARDLYASYLEHWHAAVTMSGRLDQTKALAERAVASAEPFDVIVLGSGWPIEEQAAVIGNVRAADGLSEARFVQAVRSRTRLERKAIVNTLYLDADPMRRSRLIRNVAVLAGRASPDVQYDELETEGGGREAPTVDQAAARGELILVAEDNETNRNVILRQLKLLGYAAEIAVDGKAALQALGSRSYAVLLTDCHMPEMDGYELTAAVRRKEKRSGDRLPIIAITASALQAEVDRCFEAGMDDFLAKPLEMPKLKEVLRKWMPATAATFAPAPAAEPAPAEVPAAGPIDPAALGDMFGDDPEAIREILEEFVVAARQTVEEIERAFERHAADDVGALGHKLKSSSRAVGAHGLADHCQALEDAGNANDWPTIEANMPRLRQHMGEVADAIALPT